MNYFQPYALSSDENIVTAGGLFNEGTLSMTNSTISNNQAPNGPDIFP
jgi:hypothetical protein